MIHLVAPRFWYKHRSAFSFLLMPLSWLWRFASALRQARVQSFRPRARVICIGNTVIGGAGKTPLAMGLMPALKEAGLCKNPCFLSRGYRGLQKTAMLVQAGPDAAARFGDEALLLARSGPTIVSSDRVQGLELADTLGHDLVIVDDGFQNPYFEKDASILVFDGGLGVGNGLCLPAGPCREPLSEGLKRAHAAVIVGTDQTNLRAQLHAIPVFAAHFKAAYNNTEIPYVAFAGIGRPQKFFETLTDNNFKVVSAQAFPDHHVYTHGDMNALAALAADQDARLITTEKDFVRVPDQMRAVVHVLPVTLKIDGLPELLTLLRTRLGVS